MPENQVFGQTGGDSDKYIIPTLGVWEHFDDIDFNSLPRDYPSPYAAVRRNEDGIQKGVYNGVLFIKGNLAVGRIHFRNSQKMEEIVKHQKKKEKCQRLLDTNEILLHLDFCRFPLYT